MTEVVSAVIIRDGRILLTQRRADKDFPLTWECPGGKVDGNESHHEALIREVREELDTSLAPIPAGRTSLWCREFHNDVVREDRRHIFLMMYVVELEPGASPRPAEGQGIGWFTVEELAVLTLAPGNKAALGAIVAEMSKRRSS